MPPRGRAVAVGLPWAGVAALLLVLVCCDLDVNPILDEQQWLQSGLATAHHHFVRTGLVSGPLYGLVLGALFGVVYAGGSLVGVFSGTLDFVSWFFAHQGLFYFIARSVTAGISLGGLALLARVLTPRIGALPASLLALATVFTVPAVDRIAYATPHGAMIGFSAALLWALLRARDGWRPGWPIAGALVAAATSAMTIGPGLGLLAAWGAADGPRESRGRRLGLVAAGFVGGLLFVAYPAIVHPNEYWDANVRYQVARQILSDDGGRGRILVDWLLTGSTLWIAAVAGAIWGRFPGGRGLAVAAVATAAGYVGFLAAATRSAQISYSLAALPCLAYAASGLVEPIRSLRPVPRALAWAAFLLVPAVPAAAHVIERVTVPDPRIVAARRVKETVPAGRTILVDTWYGPKLRHPRLLLAPYGKVGEEWLGDPAFRESLGRRLAPEDQAWNVIPYSTGTAMPDLQRAGVDTVILSRTMMAREPARAEWELLEKSGTLVPVPPEGPAGVRYFRVAR